MTQPHLHGARISDHQQYQGNLQALFPNSFDCIRDMKGEYDIKTDPTVPPVQHGRWKVPIEYKEEIEEELAEMVWQRIITKQTEPTHMGQQHDIPQEGKWQVKDMPRPQGLEQVQSSMRTTKHQP